MPSRSVRAPRTWIIAVALAWLSAAVAYAQPPLASPEVLADAGLTDVLFLDPDRGFAVGDRGAIWRTEDGGRHWRLVPSPVAARWESIYFLDGQNGWIVGGYPEQLTHQSVGVILRTRDGGRNWEQVPKLTMPTLKRIHFFDGRSGIALGHPSEFSPSGIFRTFDGGQSWLPTVGSAPVGWHDGLFLDSQRGVVVGPEGHVHLVSGQGTRPAELPAIGPRPVRRVAAREGLTWLCGDGGLVLASASGGVRWELPRTPIPAVARDQVDFRAIAVHKSHLWLAGAPGSVILHSPDQGATWELLRTDQTAPIAALHFLDEHRGWAVGALGTILATRDGGQTWSVQRRGGSRAALLALFSKPQRLPLEVITRNSGNDGYLSAVEILGVADAFRPRTPTVPLAERTAAAVAQVGGSATDFAWQFPLREEELYLPAEGIVALWDRTCQANGALAMEAHIVRKIRQWRPEVIVTERSSLRGTDTLGHVTSQIVLSAVTKAADPQAYPEQIAELGLQPWRPKKVFSTLPPETTGMVNLSTAQLVPRLASSLADATSTSRGLINDAFQPSPQQLGFQLVVNTLPQEIAVRDFFSGINLPAGSDARRKLSETSPTSLAALKRQAQRARNIQALMSRSAADATSGASWLGQVDDLTRGLSKESAAQTLYELAWRYHQTGQSLAAADAYQLLVERYPEHELADAASLWLVQYFASSEVGARLQSQSRVFSADGSFPERQASYLEGSGGPALATIDPLSFKPDLSLETRVRTPAATGAVARAHAAIELARKLETTRPRLYARAELRFPLASAQRQVGLMDQAHAYYRGAAQQRAHDAWWSCAAAETWLLQPASGPPKPIVRCLPADQRPKLDGEFDEEFWKNAQPLELRGEGVHGALPPAKAFIARDAEFLYLALVCTKLPGVDYSMSSEKRMHDADLALYDRVEICFDLDRDYTSYYALAVDHRGFTADACFGDASWNPTWYVAAAQDGDAWKIEAAIPLSELHQRPPQPRDAWGLGITRIMPGHGAATWNPPATALPHAPTFGLLLFE